MPSLIRFAVPFGFFLLLSYFFSCATSSQVTPAKLQPFSKQPLLTTKDFRQRIGKITGIPSEDMILPALTSPGTLFLVYDYQQEGTAQALALLTISGLPLLAEGSVPVKMLCKAPQFDIKDGQTVARMIDVPAGLSPCLTKVTGYQKDILTLNLDPDDVHVGDEYFILLSSIGSDVLTKKNVQTCTVIDARAKKTGQVLCQLENDDPPKLRSWSFYINRWAIVTKLTQGPIPKDNPM